jgi:hypothetical protein
VIQQCEDPTEVVEAHDIDASIPELSTRKSTLACTAHTYLEAHTPLPREAFRGGPQKARWIALGGVLFFHHITSQILLPVAGGCFGLFSSLPRILQSRLGYAATPLRKRSVQRERHMIQKGGLLIDFAFAWFYSVVMREGGNHCLPASDLLACLCFRYDMLIGVDCAGRRGSRRLAVAQRQLQWHKAAIARIRTISSVQLLQFANSRAVSWSSLMVFIKLLAHDDTLE